MSLEDALFVDLRGAIPLDAERCQALQIAGFSAVLISERQLTGNPIEHRRMRLSCGVARMVVVLDGANMESIDRAEAFGADGVVVRSALSAPGSSEAEAELEAGAGDGTTLRQASLVAAELGMTFAVLPETGSAQEAKVLVGNEFGDLPLFLSTDRMLDDGRRPADFRKLPHDKLAMVQLTDRHLRGLQQGEQALPGLGHLTLAPLLALLARKGFVGPWVVSPGAQTAEPATADALTKAVRLARQALLHLLDQASYGEPALHAARGLLPPQVRARGFEFIELAIDEHSRGEVEALLTALSFRLERRHHSASVELWRQGAINIVLNAEIDTDGQRPFVCDMGLRVDDAHVSAQRAGMLGAHHHKPARLPGRLPIPAMRDSLGTIVHFIDQKSDTHRVWDIEFAATASATPPPPPAGLRRVDHMAQIMPDDEMDILMLYYLSTFGLTKRTQVGMRDPAGMVASQALETREGEVRIALNGVDAAHSPPRGTSVQHVAFQTDDILETAAVLAAQGFAALPVPATYYQDLTERFALSPEQRQSLEAAGVLYDRDSSGGEFFQLYSLPLSSGLFFEIVQRKGGYSGYGAANSPVRRTALAQSHAALTPPPSSRPSASVDA